MSGLARAGIVDSAAPALPSVLKGVVRAMRPRQWLKNVLVLAPAGAAGLSTQVGPMIDSAIAFLVLSMAASGTYLLNDVADVEQDRLHPTKRHRPMAAGTVSLGLARVAAVFLIVGSLVLAAVLLSPRLAGVVGAYLMLTTSYTLWLKQVAVVDLVAIAAGFVLRTIAGAVAVDVPISPWFFIVASFGSLFVVAGKRHAEKLDLGDEAADVRSTLAAYSATYLVYVRSVASSATLVAYCLWAFEKAEEAGVAVWYQLSIVPFTLAMLRYALLLDQGAGGAPEDVLLRDRPLQVMGLLWLAVFGAALHVV